MAKNVDHSEKMPPPPSAAWKYFKREQDGKNSKMPN